MWLDGDQSWNAPSMKLSWLSGFQEMAWHEGTNERTETTADGWQWGIEKEAAEIAS